MPDEQQLATLPTGTLMQGRRGLVMGVANDRSIAWAIARACAAQGAELAFTYQGEALGRRVKPLAESVGSDIVLPCDVASDSDIDAAFAAVEARWGRLDFLVHAIGFADKQYLRGRYLDTPREAFLQALDISCYSFAAVGRRAAALMGEGGALLTLTYYGAEKWTPHYNVMGVAKAALEASVRYMAADLGERGIRVNAISAGPIKTLAASGIGDFRYILKWNQHNSPMRRNVTLAALLGRDGRGASRGLRLPHRRHEASGRAGFDGGAGVSDRTGRALGACLGLAVGDAVGATLEFAERGREPPLADMVGGGPFGLPPGGWTGDTSMALALADSLAERGRFDASDVMRRWIRWWREGAYSHTGRCFDIGLQTRAALFALDAGAEEAARLAAAQARLTHNNDEAADTAAAMARLQHGLLLGGGLSC
jgi:enoyl-[acyl-carrier protein] reductase I